MRLRTPTKEPLHSPRVASLDLDPPRLSISDGGGPPSSGRSRSRSSENLPSVVSVHSLARISPRDLLPKSSLRSLTRAVAALPRTHIDRFRQLHAEPDLYHSFEQSLSNSDATLLRFYTQVLRMKEDLQVRILLNAEVVLDVEQVEGLLWVRVTQRDPVTGLVSGTFQGILFLYQNSFYCYRSRVEAVFVSKFRS